ncbi:PEP-CTERM sorting domain-containing protein [Verrucomicrobiaceae bacterium 227]
MNRTIRLSSLLCAAVLMPIGSAQASFTLIENFEGLTAGALGTQNGWTSDEDYTLVNDPSGGGNQVLQYVAGAQGGAYLPLGDAAIGTSESGTLFARIHFDTDGNANIGLTDVNAPGAYGDFRVQINRQGATAIKGRDGGGFQDLTSTPGDLADDVATWYNVWVVANNATDTSRVFIQSDGDALFATQTEVFPPDGALNFRVAAPEALDTLVLRSQAGTFFFDDIHLSPGTDLSNPTVPEPTAPALLLLGMSAFLRRKRS